MPDIRELKDQASKYFTKGKFEKAAKAYEELCKLEPKDMQLRVRLGDALVKAGEKPAAVGAYRIAAESYAKEGFLPRAIAVCKLILEIEPGHSVTQNVLAQLYAKKTGGGAPRRPLAPAGAVATAPATAAPAAPPKGAAIIPPAPAPSAAPGEEAPLELDSGRDFKAGVTASAETGQAAASAEASGLELDTDSKASWKGAAVGFEQATPAQPAAASPAHPAPAPAPAVPPPPAPAPAPKRNLAMTATGSIEIEPGDLDTGEIDIGLPPAPRPAEAAPAAKPPPPPARPMEVAPPPPAPKPTAPPSSVLQPPTGPVPAPRPPEPAKPVEAVEPAGDDVLFAEHEEKAEPAQPPVSLKDMDLGEPELLGLNQAPPPAPAKAAPQPAAPATPAAQASAPPAVARWTAPGPAVPEVADSLEAALESATAAAVPELPAAKPGGAGGWFAEPEGTREDLTRRRPTLAEMPTLADLSISSVNEDEEIEVLTVTVDKSEVAPSLPEIPLFSDLSREAFVELASQCDLRRCQPGEVIVQQGTVGVSFFVLTSGTVKVVRKGEKGEEVVLAKLTEGSFFGEMALLSGTPRGASVVAEDEAECLEISASLLSSLTRRYPHVQQALKKFCRQRLLSNVLATSPLFRPFDKNERKALIEKFKAREVQPTEVILAEGQPADGLYVVMAGEVYVKKKKDGADVKLASLKEGEVFGEISLLTKSAATATVAAARRSTILRLPRSTFDELISTHPQILMLVSELSDERLRAQQSFEQGGGDGLTLL